MEDIIIKDFHTGIGENEFLGHGEILNCDVNNRQGIARIGLLSEKTSGNVIATAPGWIVQNPANTDELWAIDSDRNVYRGTASTQTWSTAFIFSTFTGNGGLKVWKDHLLIVRNQVSTQDTVLHAYGPLSGSATLYTLSSNLDSDSSFSPLHVGQDDIVYGGAGRYVFSLGEVAGQDFQAGTAATYTLNARALDLPEGKRVRAISELGDKLMIGTWVGTNIQDTKEADIYPWDRTSESFSLPIRVKEEGVHAMLNTDNSVYYFAGVSGNCYVTNGTEAKMLFSLPRNVLDLDNGNFTEIYPGAMIQHDNKIVFGIRNPNSSDGHVWSYNLKNGALVRENTVSQGTSVAVRVTSLLSTSREVYWIGWSASGAQGIDRVTTDERYTNYSALVTSLVIKIGSKNRPQIVSELEIQLARPLQSGQGVRLGYRTDLSQSFTNVPNGTIDFATYGNIQQQQIPFKLEVSGIVQIRAELTTGSGTLTSPELIQIVIR